MAIALAERTHDRSGSRDRGSAPPLRKPLRATKSAPPLSAREMDEIAAELEEFLDKSGGIITY